MDKRERQELQAMCTEAAVWTRSAIALQADRDQVEAVAAGQISGLMQRAIRVDRDGAAWSVIPLADSVDRVVTVALANSANLRPLAKGDERALVFLTRGLPLIVQDVAGVLNRRFFVGRKRREAGDKAVPELRSGIAWGTSQNITNRLLYLAERTGYFSPAATTLQDLLDERLGFILPARKQFGTNPALIPLSATAVTGLAPAVRVILAAVQEEAAVRTAALAAGEAVRKAETRNLLVEIPVEQIKRTTTDPLRIGPLKDVGIRTIQDVLDQQHLISGVRGVGDMTQRQVVAAAQNIWKTTYDEMPVRIDIKKRSVEATTLLTHLAKWDATRRTKGAESDITRARELAAFAEALHARTTHALVFQRRATATTAFTDSIEAVIRRAELLRNPGIGVRGPVSDDVWEDFLSRPADYFAMLSELGFLSEDTAKAHGDLPEEIVEAVRAQDLRTEHLRASLRGYQSFAARFALVQRKVIFGDEMGLGKTVEALAVLCHLRSKGASHFLVVCPASVVTNWTREIAAKTRLRPHRLHGPDRAHALRDWRRTGGVAVTTFDLLAWLETASGVPEVGCVVVDEAHYIKNPATRRAERTSVIIRECEHAVPLTGTPMENRVEEFSNLTSYIRPDLARRSAELTPRAFRKHIAPAYLRRNQEDVLTELPELVEVQEWIPMSAADRTHYRQAVAAGNFMAMRQAAFRSGSRSEKLQRLLEITEEAAKNGRKTIVYSYFLDVLATIVNALPGTVVGPLTGSVTPARRQEMVDRFTAAEEGAVLTAQITAGGVGLNIQAASVVIICEPQLKPTSEAQAVARAHRMGQVQTVQVHRLLSEEGVDGRITNILALKQQLFDEYARISATADSTPEAVDISDAELARKLVAEERERLLGTPAPVEADSDQEL